MFMPKKQWSEYPIKIEMLLWRNKAEPMDADPIVSYLSRVFLF